MAPDDKRAPPPPQPKTVELPAIPPWAAELTVLVRTVSAKLDGVIVRVDAHDESFAALDTRSRAVSDRVRQASDHDLEREAKLAEVIAWRRGVEEKLAKTATKSDLATATTAQTTVLIEGFKAAAKNPMVQKIGYAAGALVLQALALATAYLAMKGH